MIQMISNMVIPSLSFSSPCFAGVFRIISINLHVLFPVEEETSIDTERKVRRGHVVERSFRHDADAAIGTQGPWHRNKLEESAPALQGALRFEYIMDRTKEKEISRAIFS